MGLMDSWRRMFQARGDTAQLDALDQLEASGGAELAERMMEQQLAGATVDPSDPDFAPVDGVDVDKYAEICREIAHAGPQSDEQLALSIVGDHGVDPSKWGHIAEVWNERVMRSTPVKMRYAATFMGQE
jgi:hypothetical protein